MKLLSNLKQTIIDTYNTNQKDLNKAKDALQDKNLKGAFKYYIQGCISYNSLLKHMWPPKRTTMSQKQLMRIQHMTRNVGMKPVASENIRSATHVQRSDNQMSQNNANTVKENKIIARRVTRYTDAENEILDNVAKRVYNK